MPPLAALLLSLAVVSPRHHPALQRPRDARSPAMRDRRVAATPVAEAAPPSIDGVLDDAIWRHATRLTDFVQYQPLDEARPEEPTTGWVAYDRKFLYFAFHVHERSRGVVRASLHPREQGGGDDDDITLLLDTFLDHQRAYEFRVNPLGVQSDGVRAEGRGVDFSPDFVWRSAGRVTDDGWTVEIAIPFASLRFPAGDSLAIGLNVIRRYARSGESDAWVPRRVGNPCDICQEGVLSGIRGIDRGGALDVLPYLSARRSGVREYRDTTVLVGGVSRAGSAPLGFEHLAPEARVGADVRYAPTSALMLNATINPDFSQVEADADQVTVGQRFALSVPEQRPFFVEGGELFAPTRSGGGALGDLFYSRAIVAPSVGARLTASAGRVSWAALYARDAAPAYWWNDGYESSAYEVDGGPAADAAIARARVNVLDNSYVGAIALGRRAPGASDVVGGGDFALQRGAYTLSGELAASADRAPLRVTADTTASGADTVIAPDTSATLDGRARRGEYYRVGLSRSGYRLNWGVAASGATNGFRDQLGRFPRVGVRRYAGSVGVSWYPNGSIVQRVEPWLSTDRVEAYGGGLLDYTVSPSISVQFQRQTWLRLGMLQQRVTLPNDSTGRDVPLDVTGYSLDFSSSASELVSFGFSMFGGEREIYDPAAPRAGVGLIQNVHATVRPTERASLDVSAQRSNHLEGWGESLVDDATILRLRGSYQFSRALGVRVVGQYSNQYSGIEENPLDRRIVHYTTSTLVTYELAPGSFLFAGYGDERRAFQAPLVVAEQRLRTGSELFMKVSYLFRI